jgi:hypothetical protein
LALIHHSISQESCEPLVSLIRASGAPTLVVCLAPTSNTYFRHNEAA